MSTISPLEVEIPVTIDRSLYHAIWKRARQRRMPFCKLFQSLLKNGLTKELASDLTTLEDLENLEMHPGQFGRKKKT